MVLYVKEILSGDFVTTYCVKTGVDDSSLWGLNAGIVHFREVLRISVVGRSRRGFLRRIWADPTGTPDFGWGYEVMYASGG